MSKKIAQTDVSSVDANYVVLLTNAEKVAREKVEDARQRKLLKLKKARDLAQVEIEAYKIECESKLKKMLNTEVSDKISSSVIAEQELNKNMSQLKANFEKNMKSTTKDILNKFMDIQGVPHINSRLNI
jgi:ATP synthase subunit G